MFLFVAFLLVIFLFLIVGHEIGHIVKGDVLALLLDFHRQNIFEDEVFEVGVVGWDVAVFQNTDVSIVNVLVEVDARVFLGKLFLGSDKAEQEGVLLCAVSLVLGYVAYVCYLAVRLDGALYPRLGYGASNTALLVEGIVPNAPVLMQASGEQPRTGYTSVVESDEQVVREVAVREDLCL